MPRYCKDPSTGQYHILHDESVIPSGYVEFASLDKFKADMSDSKPPEPQWGDFQKAIQQIDGFPLWFMGHPASGLINSRIGDLDTGNPWQWDEDNLIPWWNNRAPIMPTDMANAVQAKLDEHYIPIAIDPTNGKISAKQRT